MGYQRFVDLLKHDDLFVVSEAQLYETTITWIRHDLNDRQKYVAELMANIRFPLIDMDYIESHIQSEPLLNDVPEYKDYYLAAKQYQASKDQPSSSGVPSRRAVRPRVRSHPNLLVAGGMQSMIFYELNENRKHAGSRMPTERMSYVW